MFVFETDPHNVYVAILAELGILGFLFFVGFLKNIYKLSAGKSHSIKKN